MELHLEGSIFFKKITFGKSPYPITCFEKVGNEFIFKNMIFELVLYLIKFIYTHTYDKDLKLSLLIRKIIKIEVIIIIGNYIEMTR